MWCRRRWSRRWNCGRIAAFPAIPSAWLIEVARNRALDALRRESSLAAKSGELARLAQGTGAAACEAMDDQLAMIFLCCHPDVPREGRVALTLKTVCGFSTGEIARAFLIQEATAAQRIVRAKRLVRDLRFELPESGELAARRESVLEVLYLLFNEGYTRNAADLAEEAIRLARLVADHDTGARAGGRRTTWRSACCNRRARRRG